MAYNGLRLNDVFNLNNDTMTTEQNEIKSAEWRKKNLSKNSVLADVSGQLPPNNITDKEYKDLMKALYPKDSSKRFRR